MNSTSVEPHTTGALLGLAIGDAMGAPVEFKQPDTFEPVAGFQSGGPHNLPAGYWTDDTSLALCSAISLIECGEFNALDHIQRFRRWFREGYQSSTGRCFDIGIQTRKAIQLYEATEEPFVGPESLNSAGNGALMRLAPLVIAYHDQPMRAMELAVEHARLTHSDPRCLDANRAWTWFMLRAFETRTKEEVLNPRVALGALKRLHSEIEAVVRGSYRTANPPEIEGSGYVVKSMEAALWAFWNSGTFEEGLLMAVNLGGDADTTGAVYGQLAGAYYGVEGIPEEWAEQLYRSEMIAELARRL